MDEFTLDFGPDPLSESEDESLDPFPPADDETNRAPIPVVLLRLGRGNLTRHAVLMNWLPWPKPTIWKRLPP